MSAKVLYSMSEKKTEMKNQMGCMNGFLHLFNRHHFPGFSTHNPKRLLPGENNQEREAKHATTKFKEKSLKETKEARRNSTDSPRASFSSSSSLTSSLSASNRRARPKHSSSSRTTISLQTPSRDSSMSQPISPPYQPQYSHKEQHVKDSYKDEQSTRSSKKEHVHSPRPFWRSNLDSPRVSSIHESYHSISTHQNAPRWSYDERESRDMSNCNLKLKERPRLSLDSRQRIIEESVSEFRSDLSLRVATRVTEKQENYRPPSNIVAKLMGLETLPETTARISEKSDVLSISSRTIDENKVNRVLYSPKSSHKDRAREEQIRASAREELTHQETKPDHENSSLSIYGEIEKKLAELDFRRSGKDLRALKQILEAMHRAKTKLDTIKDDQGLDCASHIRNSSITSGSSDMSSMTTAKTGSRSPRKIDSSSIPIKPSQIVTSPSKQKKSIAWGESIQNLQRIRTCQPMKKETVTDPILTDRDLRDPSVKTFSTIYRGSDAKATRSGKIYKVAQKRNKGECINAGKVSEKMAPRLQSQSRRLENDCHAIVASAGPCRTKKRNKKLKEPGSPNLKSRQKSLDFQCNIDQSSEVRTESTSVIQSEKASSQQSETGISEVSWTEPEVTSLCRSDYSTSQHTVKDKNPVASSIEGSMAELATATKEQPSPVSVLDATFFGDESPSPIKKKSTAFRDYGIRFPSEIEWNSEDNHSSSSTTYSSSSESYIQRPENIEELSEELWQLKCNLAGFNDVFPSLSTNENAEEAYIYEILTASGFLSDFDFYNLSNHIHQTGQAINPSLFFLLERTKGSVSFSDSKSNSKKDIEKRNKKQQRRLIFDAVNEILVRKLSFAELCCQPQPTGVSISGKQLLGELRREINQRQVKNLQQSTDDEEDLLTNIIGMDLTHRSANWTDFNNEKSGLVLDIERLIFKDLIVELITNEAERL